jgi:hypothetical protein
MKTANEHFCGAARWPMNHPGDASRVSNHVWTLEEIVDLISEPTTKKEVKSGGNPFQ